MGKTFRVKLDGIPRLGGKLAKATRDVDSEMMKRTSMATEIIWRTARAKRPMIPKAQLGRSAWHRKAQKFVREGAYGRVSDPNARLGVPVRTGNLQASIEKTLTRLGISRGWRGIIETTGVPYAGHIEYGTSKMRARPFMRPAVSMNKATIKRVFGQSIKHNL